MEYCNNDNVAREVTLAMRKTAFVDIVDLSIYEVEYLDLTSLDLMNHW